MTSITNMSLPNEVAEAAAKVFQGNRGMGWPEIMEEAIRAALQTMIDCGIAVIEDREDWENSLQSIKRSTFLVIKLRP